MNHWVAAFVGDGTRENFGAMQRTNTFHISSNKTPIRRARPGDRLLFYMAGEGFVAEGKVFASAGPPDAKPQWSSKKPPPWPSP